jgi:putative endonuclease
LSSFAAGGGPASVVAFVFAVASLFFPNYPTTMPPDHEYYVYILASRSRTLYIGVTNNLRRRVREHREGIADTFTAKYKIHRLVYYERFEYINNAIAREKYLKHFTREEKITLIESTNRTWEDLAANAFPNSLSQVP